MYSVWHLTVTVDARGVTASDEVTTTDIATEDVRQVHEALSGDLPSDSAADVLEQVLRSAIAVREDSGLPEIVDIHTGGVARADRSGLDTALRRIGISPGSVSLIDDRPGWHTGGEAEIVPVPEAAPARKVTAPMLGGAVLAVLAVMMWFVLRPQTDDEPDTRAEDNPVVQEFPEVGLEAWMTAIVAPAFSGELPDSCVLASSPVVELDDVSDRYVDQTVCSTDFTVSDPVTDEEFRVLGASFIDDPAAIEATDGTPGRNVEEIPLDIPDPVNLRAFHFAGDGADAGDFNVVTLLDFRDEGVATYLLYFPYDELSAFPRALGLVGD